MNCKICSELYDHSIHKPCSLISCSHTYCQSCLNKLEKSTDNKCPSCSQVITGKNPNHQLLETIPESNYDKLKSKSLTELIEINKTKQDMLNKGQKKFNQYETKLTLIKKLISDETIRLINILKENETILLNQCESILNDFNSNLNQLDHDTLVNKQKIDNN